MFSKVLIKLIDEAIIPAILLLATRLVSVVLISTHLEIPYSVGPSGFTFPGPAEYVLINSYSIIAMLVVLSLGLGYILLKSLAFHSSHIDPKSTAKVFSLRLSHLIQNSFDLYSQGAIWVSYLYLITIVAGIMSLFGLLFSWVFYIALFLCVGVTLLFVLDIEKEVELGEMEDEDFSYYEDDEDTLVLEFGDDYV
jgi:hypothetical protein